MQFLSVIEAETALMCGIAGFVGASPQIAGGNVDAVAEAMAASLALRGPDDQGIWSDPEAGTALAHRRLSIIDLSPAGHQPMVSADGRFIISYNGEVYSYQPIAAELAARGCKFRGHSDTEVILESFAANGIEPTLKRMIGMFAIALWDRRERTLTLIRDRLGIKPVYWAKFGGLFLFGSELKALRAIRAGRRASTATPSPRSCVAITFRRRIRSTKAFTNSSPARC
jgi:asparagine synthase (glutamine-hydrolysing)